MYLTCTVRVIAENGEWRHFGSCQDWRNQDLKLEDLPVTQKIIVIKTT